MKKLFLLLFTIGNICVIMAQESNLGRFNLSADAGWGYRLGKMKEDNDYLTSSRSGLSVSADAAFYFRPKLGLGFKYSFFYASNDLGNIWNKTYINYVGPAYYGRINPFGSKSKIRFIYSASLGYIRYKEDCRGLLDSDYVLNAINTANALGLYVDFGVEYQLAPRLFLIAKIYCLASSYKRFTLKTPYSTFKEVSDKRQNISHLGASLGLKLSL